MDRIDSGFLDEFLEHLVAVLKIDTSNPPGNERPLAEYLAQVFENEDIPYQLIEPAPNRTNIIARLGAGNPERALILSAHMDVVPADPEDFKYPPFSATIADGFIWARGALDMKYHLIYNLAAFLAAHRTGRGFNRDLVFAAVADEEAGGTYGSRYLATHHPDLIKGEYCLTEMGGVTFEVGKQRFYPLQVAQRGFASLQITAEGESGHGSIYRDAYATKDLIDCLKRLGKGRFNFSLHPATRAMINGIADSMPVVISWALKVISSEKVFERVIPKFATKAEILEYLVSVTHDTVTITSLNAPSRMNVIPSKAQATLDLRILPGHSTEDVIAWIRDLLGDQCKVDVLGMAEPYEAPMESELVSAIKRAVFNTDPTAKVVPYMLSGYTDAVFYAPLGIKTYGFGPLPLPPELKASKLIHGKDERIPVEGFKFGLSMYVKLVLDFISTPPQQENT